MWYCSSGDSLTKIGDGAHAINLGVYASSFGVEHIPKKKKKIHWKQNYHNEYL